MNRDYQNIHSGSFLTLPTEMVVFGLPAEEAVLAELQRRNARRAFVVSTRSLQSLADSPLHRIVRALGAHHAGTFAEVRAHAPREDVIAGARQAREAKADILIAVGGGSTIDAAKVMQMCLWFDLLSTQSLEPYLSGGDIEKQGGTTPATNAIRMIAVPTTLSAAEFTPMAGITNSETKAKQAFRHPLFGARLIVLDPSATLDTPDSLLFSSGVKAVDHAVETFCALNANPATEALSLQGLRLLSKALPEIRSQPSELQPRMNAQFGMWQAIAPFVSGAHIGASHGLGQAIGSSYQIPHGQTSCILLPAVLRWNAAENAERQEELSAAMSRPDRAAADLVAELVETLGEPTQLRSTSVKRSDFDEIARRALLLDPVRRNPRPINSVDDIKEILELAW